MGRKTLTISDCFLPMLFGKGEKHYEITRNALPDDCRVINIKLDFPHAAGAHSFTLLLESPEWPESAGGEEYPRLDVQVTQLHPNKSWRDDPLL